MESYNSIFSVVVALLATTFFCSYSANSYVSSLAVEQEAKALLQAGWWTHDSLNTSTLSPCNLSGITCNHFGSITHISLPHNSKVQKRLGRFLNSSSFPNLVHLNLAEAGFVGSIPPAIGTLSKLAYLNLSNNNLTGDLPLSLGNLSQLLRLDISYNLINGSIPPQLGNLSNLRVLNLSSNQINGRMPSTLGLLFNLTHLDISSNKIEVMLGALSYARRFKNNKGQPVSKIRAKNGDIFFILNYDGKIAYHDIIEATEDFDIRYCIGTGGYGSVYRAQLPGGKVVALKKLHGSEVEQPNLRKSFMNEVKTLTEIRHRNIVRLHGFCLNKRCMFLIYEYMERGSLFCVLNNDAEAVELDWSKRVNIIKGIVHALCYMHHDRTPPIVHRDVTSNNILLNAELEAVVSDFGTAKLLDPDSSNQTIIVGTYGYIAPGKFMLLISSSFYICL
ncbi:MDIS1-interacting receptor like kinase 2-like isoform X4 [Ziziphus jujuba]|uniref:non-specific serine/threonine protein kinase n=1 Tax=Ziziphus jujuba TaxID=326968 RepID=A0ABM4A650_ZIZJJ|nr:MDIS1-interacting receptor like kinase 2-like isoform X4 [Ziziphus jujuba]